MPICPECGSRGGGDDGVVISTIAADAAVLFIECRSCFSAMRLGAKVLADSLAVPVGDARWSDIVVG